MCVCVCVGVCVCMCETLGFMLYAFVRQNESFQKRAINKVEFLFEGEFCLCVCVPKFVWF